MRQPLHKLEVLADFLHLDGVVRELRRQRLEGDGNAADLVETAEHDAHAALAELAVNAVRPSTTSPVR